jgi:hypothetical protein
MINFLEMRKLRQVVAHVMLKEPETRMTTQVIDVGEAASDEVVDADNVRAGAHQVIAEVRPDEPRATRNECSHGLLPFLRPFPNRRMHVTNDRPVVPG